MFSHCVNECSTQSLERHSSLRPDRKNKKNAWSLIDYAVSHTAHDVGKNLDNAGAVVCGSTLLRCGVCDPCCARSECERHSHRTIPVEEDAGIKLVLFLHVTAQRDTARSLAWVVADKQDWTAKATLTWQAGRAVAHKLRASSPAFPWRQNFDNTGAVVCDSRRAATSALARVLL